ncbi:MAG: D-alanyl-D-alanine carboxypeptidase [Peptococcaceae bacterium]|jgi:D-alanyl-D-alanine carboxypeptidase (penicillin-binding protein 5/6)|nr:D-alanyl-D-alanine carboxypeptidase [Peptococcaceae bacterium]
MRRYRRGKKFALGLAFVLLWGNLALIPITPTPVSGAELETEAVSAVLMDAASGRIFYEKEAHKEMAPASVTKVMTLLLAAEAIESGRVALTDQVTASEKAAGMGGSQIYLEAGESFSLEEMLIAIAVGSANDACVAVAEHISGSLEAFVEAMNARAQELGLVNTHFMNNNGLPAEGHYTSAYDLAVISRKTMEYPLIQTLTSIKEYDLRDGEFKLWNTNKLLWWYEGADGLKTGWTTEADYCLASTVMRDGLRLICVVMGVPQARGHFSESMKIYNYGFAQYAYKLLAPAQEKLGVVQVRKGAAREVAAVTEISLGITTEKGKDKDYWLETKLEPEVVAPVSPGQKLGEAILYQGDAAQWTVNLVAQQPVARLGFLRQISRTVNEVLGIE